jgi:hypothetical protein
VLAGRSVVFAQADVAETAEKAPFRLGPLRLRPTIALTHAGIDQNVFNTTHHPQSDFTMTLTPQTDLYLRVGRVWLAGRIAEDLTYFHRFASERSANTSYKADAIVPLNRLLVQIGGSHASKRDRPGFEIDARSQHTQDDVAALVEYRVFGKTYVGLSGRRSTVAFDQDDMFLGSSLRRELNRTSTVGGVSVRHQLTPITAVTFRAERDHDGFEFADYRDSNGTRIVGGLKFDPYGVIAGSAEVGYRRFENAAGLAPDFMGTTARVDVSYRARASTRLAMRMVRDVEYSYEVGQPYYVQTGIGGSITQQVGGPFDLVARAETYRLAYRGEVQGPLSVADRTDALRRFGGGIGYRLGASTRVGFDVDSQQRISEAAGRSYDGLRYGTSVTYGF